MQDELQQLYRKLLKWSVTVVILFVSKQLLGYNWLGLVVISGGLYCLIIFTICVYLQIQVLKK
ncbi:hypothetical protein [Liquorilactobacillus capillatus]|uniref:Uncharacterized protein n=1 Tax=Liquorilactobacillus capillatus DSM 19910 TaxID=1423731 RepID=A0A0R1M4X5_9LACO|nr:hypothetical protein [Liquorilactobacillus capillatus]KRL03070.1 hypothetical protein FC81_GL000337 [Liquorilactobacillus capillatus DSM 19910]